MRKSTKSIAAVVLSVLMVMSLSVASFAADLSNSVGTNSGTSVLGSDATQSKVGSYITSVDNVAATSDTVTEDISVYATQASTYSVRVPKTVILDGANGVATYTVGVMGNISGNQTISIVPTDSDVVTAGVNFDLVEQNATIFAKANVLATITQAKTIWNQSEINNVTFTEQTCSIAAPSITAGSWSGNFSYTISLVNA